MPLVNVDEVHGVLRHEARCLTLEALEKCECLLVGWQVVAASSAVDADFSEVDVP